VVHGYAHTTRLVLLAADCVFEENLIEPGLVYTIGTMNKILTACGDGRIPFISADDIAEVAFRALTDKASHNCDHRVLGPELLTYDDVRSPFSNPSNLLTPWPGSCQALQNPGPYDRTREAGPRSSVPELSAGRPLGVLCALLHWSRS